MARSTVVQQAVTVDAEGIPFIRLLNEIYLIDPCLPRNLLIDRPDLTEVSPRVVTSQVPQRGAGSPVRKNVGLRELPPNP